MNLAIDPGNIESAYVLIHPGTLRPVKFGKLDNHVLIQEIRHGSLGALAGRSVIEMVEAHGMPVGREVFETCVWIGRFQEALFTRSGQQLAPVKRLPVRIHHCRSPKAKDTNVVHALVDRFAPGQPNYGKGTKAAPGWFHGFFKDIWQAYALAVYDADVQAGRA